MNKNDAVNESANVENTPAVVQTNSPVPTQSTQPVSKAMKLIEEIKALKQRVKELERG